MCQNSRLYSIQNVHSKLSYFLLFSFIFCENSCPFLIFSVLPKDHTKVIIVSVWFRTHIWVKWLSQVYRKIRPLPSVSLLFMLAWKIDFESQRHKIVWLWNKMYDFGMALETFIDTKFVKAGNNLLTFCNCNFAKWFCTFFVSLKMICY